MKRIICIGLFSALLLGTIPGITAQPASHSVEVKGISEAAFSPSGNLVALGGQDNVVYLLDPTTGSVIHKYGFCR